MALGAFEGVLTGQESGLVVADLDWERFIPGFTITRPSGLFDDLDAVRELRRRSDEAVQAEAGVTAGLAARLTGLSLDEGPTRSWSTGSGRTWLACSAIRQRTDHCERAFKELGFDSVTAAELRKLPEHATIQTHPQPWSSTTPPRVHSPVTCGPSWSRTQTCRAARCSTSWTGSNWAWPCQTWTS